MITTYERGPVRVTTEADAKGERRSVVNVTLSGGYGPDDIRRLNRELAEHGVEVKPVTNVLKLIEELGLWGSCEDFPRHDWKFEVFNDDTNLGYWDWVAEKFSAKWDA